MSVYDPYSTSGEHGLTAKKPDRPGTAWMVSVADLFSLMLTFFVMLYSMSTLQQDTWDAVSQSLMQRVQIAVDEEITPTASRFSVPRADFVYARGLDYLGTIMEKRFTPEQGIAGVAVTHGDDRIILSLVSDGLFAKGSATVSPEGRETLHQIGLFLANIGNRLTIEGHTDPSPIHSATFPSNWELSLARATAVAGALREAGYPYALDVHGLGSSRHEELAHLPAARQDEMARRVDIIVRENVAKYGPKR